MGLFCPRSDKDGIWDFLGKRTAAKYRVELEKERNEGTQRAIQLLTPGMVLREGGPDWTREIQHAGHAPIRHAVHYRYALFHYRYAHFDSPAARIL